MKKVLSLGMAVVLGLSLTACGGKMENKETTATQEQAQEQAESVQSGKETTQAASNEELVATRWSGGQSDDQKELVKGYTASEIVIDDVAYDKLKEKETLSMQKSGGGDYDLIYVAEVWCPDYASNGWLLPLNDYIEKYNVDLSMYNQSLLDTMTVDGKIMSLPTFTQTSILAYDETAMQRYGGEVPKTFDELIACAKWFKENEGTGIAIPAMQGQAAVDLFGAILYSCGGEFIKDGKADLGSDEAAQAITIWQELCKYAMDGASTWHVDDVGQAMKDGVAPISISLSGNCSAYLDPEQSAVAETVKFAGMPGVGDKDYVGTANFWGWSVAANSENPDEAFQAAVWLTSPEQEKSASLANGSISALPELAEDQEVLEKIPYLPAVTEALAHARILPTAGDSSTMLTGLQAVLSEIATDPDTDSAALIKSYNESCKDYQFGR